MGIGVILYYSKMDGDLSNSCVWVLSREEATAVEPGVWRRYGYLARFEPRGAEYRRMCRYPTCSDAEWGVAWRNKYPSKHALFTHELTHLGVEDRRCWACNVRGSQEWYRKHVTKSGKGRMRPCAEPPMLSPKRKITPKS